jgi:surface antigen
MSGAGLHVRRRGVRNSPSLRRALFSLGAGLLLAAPISVIGVALGGSSASAHTRSGVKLVYVMSPLQEGGLGEVVAAVPPNSDCTLTIKLQTHVESTSSSASSPTGQVQYVWTVPPKITAGTRTALVSCVGGAKATAPIAVTANAGGAERPVASTIRVYAIQATDSPAMIGKGNKKYPRYHKVILPSSAWFGGAGVNVYSDGGDDKSGYYQSVELANRFMTTKHFGPAIWGNANQLYANAPAPYYQEYANGAAYTPVPGDLVVFGADGYGAVGIVDSVTSSSVNLVEENASPTARVVVTLTGTTLGGQPGLNVTGIIHAVADSAPVSPPPPKDPPSAAPPTTSTTTETTGSITHTWSDYADAGGIPGPTLPPYDNVGIACKITGFTVADGNTWWYQLAPTTGTTTFYASADAFYNNGATSGSLLGTPFYDPEVPTCTIPPTGYNEVTGTVSNTWTDYTDAGGSEGQAIASNDTVVVTCASQGFTVADGDTWWYLVASSPWNDLYYASAADFYNDGQSSGSLASAPFVDPSVPDCEQALNETTGSVTHTWADYSDAGGSEGPVIGSNATVAVTCRVMGFRVADGNTWWYQIASSPWNNMYYASADAFYNNGETSGSLLGTPFYDPSVPIC